MRIFLTLSIVLLCTGCSPFSDSKTSIPLEPNDGIGDGAMPLNQLLAVSFDKCLIAGGDIMESSPRQCALDGETFTEVFGPENKGESLTRIFQIAPEKTTCYGAHPRECMVVNRELFYSNIEGFSFEEDYEYILKVEQTKYCDPDLINDCPQDVGIYKYSLIEEISKTKGNTAKEKCKETGGKYEKGGKLQQYFCNKKSETAGESCTSSGECDGFCLDTTEGGKCSEYETNFGCTDILEKGKKTTICVD